MPFADKPIIGLAGGVGAGKSFVARLLQSLGCVVIDSDRHARDAFADQQVIAQLVTLFGLDVLTPDGTINRKAVAACIFEKPAYRAKLEQVIHPIVGRMRDEQMKRAEHDTSVRAFVWDSPLLMEAGLDSECDAVIFVETPIEQRLERVKSTRGWNDAELRRREAAQLPVEEKRRRATHVVRGDADEVGLRPALQQILNTVTQQ